MDSSFGEIGAEDVPDGSRKGNWYDKPVAYYHVLPTLPPRKRPSRLWMASLKVITAGTEGLLIDESSPECHWSCGEEGRAGGWRSSHQRGQRGGRARRYDQGVAEDRTRQLRVKEKRMVTLFERPVAHHHENRSVITQDEVWSVPFYGRGLDWPARDILAEISTR